MDVDFKQIVECLVCCLKTWLRPLYYCKNHNNLVQKKL